MGNNGTELYREFKTLPRRTARPENSYSREFSRDLQRVAKKEESESSDAELQLLTHAGHHGMARVGN